MKIAKISLFLAILTFATTTLNPVLAQTTNSPAASPPPAGTPTVGTNEVAELKAQIADLSKQVGELSKSIGEYAKANAALVAALTNRPAAAPPQTEPVPQPAMPLQWRRTPHGGWFLGPPVSGASPSQNGAPSDAQVAAIVRNAPGRVVGITVAPPRLGVPSFAHIASDGSVYYSLAPARGNF